MHPLTLMYKTAVLAACSLAVAGAEHRVTFDKLGDIDIVDESKWADEPIPAEHDPEVARLLAIYNAPEGWDHF
jgi:hypothetical protein